MTADPTLLQSLIASIAPPLVPWIVTATLWLVGAYYTFSVMGSKRAKHIIATSTNSDDIIYTEDGSTMRSIPWAPGCIPLLGHALEYQKDPSRFLLRAARESGCSSSNDSHGDGNSGDSIGGGGGGGGGDGIFQLNLAGKHMIVVCDAPAVAGDDGDENDIIISSNSIQRQLATMPESILSAKQAVADIGFEQTLGALNVYEGTTLHKGIIKGHLLLGNGNNGSRDAMVAQWTRSIQEAMRHETSSSSPSECEFLDWMRRVMLRTTLDVMVGKDFLQMERDPSHKVDEVDFLLTFMAFQDTLEDVTAKAVVLPRPIALNFFLRPLERRREKLQKVIEKRLNNMQHRQKKSVNGNGCFGFWLREVLNDDKKYSLANISEFIVGLLFAAHKNPAIGAAQSYLFLRESSNENNSLLETSQKEARQFLSRPTWEQVVSAGSNYTILQSVCLESLRVTAHSIGAVRTAKQDVTIEVRKASKNDGDPTSDDA
ncbi:MAG: hypothetical protein SGILL_006925, partial [Bacillariaceae sp.]